MVSISPNNLILSDPSVADVLSCWKVSFSSTTETVHINSFSTAVSADRPDSYQEYHSGIYRHASSSCVTDGESFSEFSQASIYNDPRGVRW